MEIVRRRWLQDVAVVAVVAVVTGADVLWNRPGTRQADASTLMLLGLSIAEVLVRRRWPVPMAAGSR